MATIIDVSSACGNRAAALAAAGVMTIIRRRAGKAFRYLDPEGRRVRLRG